MLTRSATRVGLTYILYLVALNLLATNEVILIIDGRRQPAQERYLLLQTGAVNKFSLLIP